MHGRGHYCSRAKPATPLNIKLSIARRSASADDGLQMSSLLAAVAAPHAPVTNPRQGRRVDDVRDSCFRGGAGVRGANVVGRGLSVRCKQSSCGLDQVA